MTSSWLTLVERDITRHHARSLTKPDGMGCQEYYRLRVVLWHVMLFRYGCWARHWLFQLGYYLADPQEVQDE